MNEEIENRNCPCEVQSNCPCNNNKQSNCQCNKNDKKECPCNRIESYVDNMNDKCKDDTRRELINKIKCYEFAVIELALYLDTHPEDEKALCLHKKYCKELKELKDKYQKVYGPLTINFPCNKWRWIEEPWPWVGLG